MNRAIFGKELIKLGKIHIFEIPNHTLQRVLIKREFINNKDYQSLYEIQADICWNMNFYNKSWLHGR